MAGAGGGAPICIPTIKSRLPKWGFVFVKLLRDRRRVGVAWPEGAEVGDLARFTH